MDEALLHHAFLAVLPTCLQLSGWKHGDGSPIWSTDDRVRLAWRVAIIACEMHPTRPANAGALEVPAKSAASE